MTVLRFQRLESASDPRGDSFRIPQGVLAFMGGINEMHFVTIEPGEVRGNHCHRGRKEFMFVYYGGDWMLAWRHRQVQDISTQEFTGGGGYVVEIAPDVVHAVKNTGNNTLYLLSCSDAPYTPADTERIVILE